jgi:uncharacterized protein YlxW (UPF0749 family)
MRLYDLTSDYAAIQEAAERGEDVAAIESKAAGLVYVLANLEADAGALETEAKRLAAKRKTAEREVERVREYIRTCMVTAGVTRIKGPTFTITLSDGKPKVVVHSLEAIKEAAPELVRRSVEESVDKAAVLERFTRDGECVPGTEIVATTTLRIS